MSQTFFFQTQGKLTNNYRGDANPFDGFSGSDCSLDKGYVYCYTHEKKIESKNLGKNHPIYAFKFRG